MTKSTPSYAELSAELDEVLLSLQSTETGLDESVVLYRRGLELIKILEKELKTTENTISKLKLQASSAEKS